MIGVSSTSRRLAANAKDRGATGPVAPTEAQLEQAQRRTAQMERLWQEGCGPCVQEHLGTLHPLIQEHHELVCLVVHYGGDRLPAETQAQCATCPMKALFQQVWEHAVPELTEAQVHAARPALVSVAPGADTVLDLSALATTQTIVPPRRPRPGQATPEVSAE